MKPIRVALATCRVLPEPDTDYLPLSRALERRGCAVAPWAWDSPDDSGEFDVCVLRSTWNYYHTPEKFATWIDDVARRCHLINPASIVRWNMDKRYLRELGRANVPIVDTIWFEPGDDADKLVSDCGRQRWRKFVVKPTVSAASYGTRLFSEDELPAAVEYLDQQLKTRGMMVQPFFESVTTVGEKSIAWINGKITHAWIKRPRFAGEHESVQPTEEITRADRALVEAALQGLRGEIAYARIDVMYDAAHQPRVSELELIEPSLYFDFSAEALNRFADAIVQAAAGQTSRLAAH